jgi:hypothetical protein
MLSSVGWVTSTQTLHLKEEFEGTKGAITIRLSKKNRQHNGNVTQIYLYSLVHNTKDSEFPVKEFLRKKKRSSRGWQRFNVINQVEKWHLRT